MKPRLPARHLAGLLVTAVLLPLAACSGGDTAALTEPVELRFREVTVDAYAPPPADGKPPKTTVDELTLAAVYDKIGDEAAETADHLSAPPTDAETLDKLAPFAELSPDEVAVLPPMMRFYVPTVDCARLDARDRSADADDELLVVCSGDAEDTDRKKYLLGKAKIENSHVASAEAELDDTASTEVYRVKLTFTETGGELWIELTAKIRGRQLAIVTDGTVLAAPTVSTVQMTTTVSVVSHITGDYTRAEAEKLAAGIEAGI